jgi:hypothetical protein
MSLPDFLCIGAQKAGTTWLDRMLRQSPHIWLPPMKELHYFDRVGGDEAAKQRALEKLVQRASYRGDKKPARRERAENIGKVVSDDFLTESWYRSVFDAPERQGKRAGEITPAYLILDDEGLEEVKRLLPAAKVFVIVREPLARHLSQLRMALSRSRNRPETEAEWRDFAIARIDSTRRGDYLGALPKWQALLAPEQFLVLPFGEIKRNPRGLLRQIEDFIGAQPFDAYDSAEEAVHKTKEVEEIPQWVIDALDERAASQREFLIRTFGQDFYEKTR